MKDLTYFRQGDDGLCGFYAALNSFSVLLRKTGRPISATKKQAFFDSGIDLLMMDEDLQKHSKPLRILKGNSQVGGINCVQIARLCRRIAEKNALNIEISTKNEKTGSVTFM